MSEILSQNKIDELLDSVRKQGANNGGLSPRKTEHRIRAYDFRIPKKLNKDQMKTLNIIYSNYERALSSYLSGALRTYCKAEVLTIEEQRYYEFSNAITDNYLVGLLELQPLQGTTMVTVSQPLVFTIIDRLLGGGGGRYDVNRDYTEIELTVMEGVMREISGLLKDAWSNVYDITPSVIRVQGNARQMQFVSPNETVVIAALSVKIRETEGSIGFCMPYEILKPVLENLNTHYWFTEPDQTEENRRQNKDALLGRLEPIGMEMAAVLGTGHITLREILELRPGDVIRLEQRTDSHTTVCSGGKQWFKGTLGLCKNHVAVRVDEVLNDSRTPEP